MPNITTSIEKLKSKSENEYPYLGLHKNFNVIVLFTNLNTGIVIHSTFDNYKIGDYGERFEENYDKFYGIVRIESK